MLRARKAEANDSLERRRAERVEAEPFPCVHDGQLARHGQHGALASGIRQLRRGTTDEGDDARGVDDAGVLLAVLAEAQYRVLATVPNTLCVDVEGKIPDLVRRLHSIGIIGVHDPSVVEHDVDAAPGVDVGDGGCDGFLLGDVAGLCLDAAGVGDDGAELGDGAFESLGRDVG